MINPPKATKPPTIERKAIMDWSAGTITDYDARRVVDNALMNTANMVVEQNGIIRPRPALVEYGPQPVGQILGQLYECKVAENSTPVFYLIAMMENGDHANLYRAKGEDETWEIIEGHDYIKAKAHFEMIANKVLVMNGEDHLTYIDTEAWEVVEFNELTTPENAPTLVEATGLDGTETNIYYAITANSTVGETAGSPVLMQPVSTQRDLWNPETQSVKISWNAVTGATSYNVYMGTSADGQDQPNLYMIAQGLEPHTTSFTDNGTAWQNIQRGKLPVYNSTAGPRAKRGAVVNGRIWLVGDKDAPFYVRYGGDAGNELDFSPVNGGGFVAVSQGTKELPISVMPFRTGQGNSTVTVLTQGSNGSGKRYNISSNTMSYGGMSFTYWAPLEDAGADGTDSPDGVVMYNNSLYYPSRDGFKTTGTIPQLQNVLSTTRISETIKNEVSLLNNSAISGAMGLAYEGKIYWTLPVGSSRNNRVWVFDVEHRGAWILTWYLNVDWMTLYNDNYGKTRLLMLSDNHLYEMSRLFKTKDGGEPFKTELKSGEIEWTKDGREWARLIQVVFTLLKPQGEINIEVFAKTEDGEQRWIQAVNVSQPNIALGWSEGGKGWSAVPRGWGSVSYQQVDDQNASIDVMVEVDEDVQYFGYRISSSTEGVDYALSGVVAEYVPIGIKDLS